MFAYTGRILHIDLTNKTTRIQRVGEDFLKKYVGGVCMAARLAYDNIPKGADPLGPDNALCFANSAFAATIVPVGNKYSVAAKSPLTGFLGDCLSTSYFAAAMRQAGYDGIVIKGKAEKPTYIFIDDDVVQFRDASHLWGMETWETEEAIRAEMGDEMVRTCVIGPAGENLVRFANITNDRGRQAGRTGLGAVMGSKLLKAVAIRGTKPVTVADPDGLRAMALELSQKAQGPKTEKYRILGTPANVLVLNRLGVLPTRNFQQGTFEAAEKVSGEYMHEHHKEKAVACAGCPIACEQVVSVREGAYKGARTSVDYESLYALGTNCGLDYFPGIIKAIELCDRYGMDTMSCGVTIAWAMECFEKGILTKEDFGGLELHFGNHEAEVALVEMIARREGIGDLLAEGVKRASEKVDKGSERFAMHVKGLEFAGYDVRGCQTFALGAAVGTRGPCHNRSLAYEADTKGMVELFKAGPERGQIAKDKEDFAAVLDVMMFCKFIRGCFKDLYAESAQFYTLTTGIEMTAEDVRKLGERAWNLKKAFNIREGWTREDDWLPPRCFEDPIVNPKDGKGYVVKPEDLRMMIDAYYEARGWTKEGLIPKEKLIELGLEDIAEELGV
ncbi:MAG TPA: aldehyde:ferredoxin oxidoreductase [Anaerolineae bacterium]|nr:aldehyde:ferredoxin oxidoreductase [Anaerolineae bacterium]